MQKAFLISFESFACIRLSDTKPDVKQCDKQDDKRSHVNAILRRIILKCFLFLPDESFAVAKPVLPNEFLKLFLGYRKLFHRDRVLRGFGNFF